MAEQTKIEWTHAPGFSGATWNPIRATPATDRLLSPDEEDAAPVGHYCEMTSPGCAKCYSSVMQKRFRMPAFTAGQQRDKVRTFLDSYVLAKPLKWRKPKMIFVCSMTDLFGEWVPNEWIDQVFAIAALCPQHVFQVLTKRADRLAEYSRRIDRYPGKLNDIGITKLGWCGPAEFTWPLPNCWLGVSCEDQKRADERIPHLLKTPAAVRFVSAEPLLAELDFNRWMRDIGPDWRFDADGNAHSPLDWLLVGGESGHGARPCDIEWIRSIRDQCKAAGVSCFIKQLGARPQGMNGPFVLRDPKGGNPAEWPPDLRVREWPNTKGPTT